jgi:hypothetical protein
LDHPRVDIKSGRTFDCVERGDASAGAGADIDQASALGERGGDQLDCLRDLRQSALHGGCDLGVFTVDDAGDFEGGFADRDPAEAELVFSVPRRWSSAIVVFSFNRSSPRLQPPHRETPGAPV